MTADLRRFFCTTGLREEFDCRIESGEFPRNESYTVKDGALMKGSIYNRADVVHLDYSVEFTLNIVCDRCLRELERDFRFEFGHIVVKNVSTENDEYIVAENDRVDLNSIALSDLLLSLPTKMLCRGECRGLCPQCGHDLNESDCDCRKN